MKQFRDAIEIDSKKKVLNKNERGKVIQSGKNLFIKFKDDLRFPFSITWLEEIGVCVK